MSAPHDPDARDDTGTGGDGPDEHGPEEHGPEEHGPTPPAARRFIALPLPRDVRTRLAAALPDDPGLTGGLRWARPEGWHATIAFLGEVPDALVAPLVDAVDAAIAAAPAPEELTVTEAGRFGRAVLWVALQDAPAGSLAALAAAVRRAVDTTGLPVDRKPFRAHVTLARGGQRNITSRLVAACAVPEGLRWRPEAIEVWRSYLGRGPARYESEARIPLRA